MERSGLREIAADLAAEDAWGDWPVPRVVGTTTSTMRDVEAAAAEGAPEGYVVLAEEQTAGRGRRGRDWESAKHAGLWFSILLRPEGRGRIAVGDLGWLPLVVGLGAAEGMSQVAGLPILLKWPNDLVVRTAGLPSKVGGILAERLSDGAVIVGIGLNVDHEALELPEGAASLRTLGAERQREEVFVKVLAAVARRYRDWRASGAPPTAAYCGRCVTLGSRVRMNHGGRVLEGTAVRIDEGGRLVIIDAAGQENVVTAGDVSLVRPLG